MTEVQTQTTNTKRTLGLIIAAVVLIGGVVFGAVQLSGGNDSTAPSGGTVGQTDEGDEVQQLPTPLPKAMAGQEAIDALGDDIDLVAKRNNMTTEKLEELLLKDPTAHISKTGHLMYKDTAAK